MKQRVLGSLVRRRRSTARPLHRCGAAATAHPVPGRGGQKGTEGDQRLLEAPTKGSAHLGPGRQERGRSARSLRSFRACAPTGAAILSRKPARGSRRGAGGAEGAEEEGGGRAGRPPPTARPAPSARPRLVTLGRGRTLRERLSKPCVPHDDRHPAPNSLSAFGASSSALPRVTV